MPQKRRRRRRRLPQGGPSRRRLDEDGASLPGSPVYSDSGSATSRVDGGSPPPELPDEPVMSPPEPRYLQFIASRLARLELPAGDDGSDLGSSPNLPSTEILEALTRKSFHDDDLRAALVEYQIQGLGPDIQGRDSDSGESEPDDAIRDEEYTENREVLGSRIPDIDTYTKLDHEQIDKLDLKYARYRIKAALLLKGKLVGELDDAALEQKYPTDLIVENNYFFHYVHDGYFGWYFDSDLCYKKCFTDYQRLVILNGDGSDEYNSYRAFYSTPEADRDYLRYWEKLVKKIKWLDQYVLMEQSSIEWLEIRLKASIQAIKIAASLPNMNMELAAVGFTEHIWNAHTYLLFVKDLDGVFYEIWRRVNEDHQQDFRAALKQVYGEKLFPARDGTMKYELEYGNSKLDLLFRQCTGGLSKGVPECTARKLIAQEILWRGGYLSGTYAHYARKKLKIAEILGLIPKEMTLAA